jgi:hypothetical protein
MRGRKKELADSIVSPMREKGKPKTDLALAILWNINRVFCKESFA